ncbi:NUDIX domain-containing protein [Streptomyces sp. ISL-94]|uniref:NUDIX hydrolase n=1 Tax=Streptomyces sp. ISL-94 TaxID=2819190 RepID=UPI001BEB5547|nr:NUDIX domain-containing protein [Streptomyces sp. ISL-94]MBT2480108.1 NUDIX domain-containing protein [Streptomyces sp. ISL-94]
MTERVRAVLITPATTLLLIKRVKPGIPAYWVVPGGGVEPTDRDHEDALRREIREEIAGEIGTPRLLCTLTDGEESQHFYIADIKMWSFEDRAGPEFSQEGRGEYLLDEIPLTAEALRQVNLKPDEITAVLIDALATGQIPAAV